MIFEFVPGGELFCHLRKCDRFPTQIARFYLAEISCALGYIHDTLGVVYRDLKPENIFIDDFDNARIADFGFTEYVNLEELNQDEETFGTEKYMAPELLERKPFSEKCEIYSLGLILFEIFTGQHPYDRLPPMTEEEFKKYIEAMEDLPFKPDEISTNPQDGKLPLDLTKMISKCCCFHPDCRPELTTVLQTLVDLGVKAVVYKSNSAANHWIYASRGVYRKHIKVIDFAKTLHKEAAVSIADTLTRTCPSSWKLLDIQHYWCLCCWFPNFFQFPVVMQSMDKISKSVWYARDEEEASTRLNRAKGDVFLIRPSTVNMFSCPFTLCTLIKGTRYNLPIRRVLLKGQVAFECDLFPKTNFATLKMLMLSLVREKKYLVPKRL